MTSFHYRFAQKEWKRRLSRRTLDCMEQASSSNVSMAIKIMNNQLSKQLYGFLTENFYKERKTHGILKFYCTSRAKVGITIRLL